MKPIRGILMIVPTFSPNVGGVETHMDDLVKKLGQLGIPVYVHTYSPITTPGVAWQARETRGSVSIRRYAWFGKTLLHRLEKYPLLDFLYITPYLFVRVFWFFLLHSRDFDVIHAQGLNAAFIGALLKVFFRKRLIVSTHALYNLTGACPLSAFVRWILRQADRILTLARTSQEELLRVGLDPKKVGSYRYWIDLERFRPVSDDVRRELRTKHGWPDRPVVFFSGRLTEIKGVGVLLEVARQLPEIDFVFAGTGPWGERLTREAKERSNVRFLGRIENRDLWEFYNMADLFCIPSQYPEGYARVMMESVACGLSIVGTNLGCIPEVLDERVSVLVGPGANELKDAIRSLMGAPERRSRLRAQCRAYALERFSETNSRAILDAYQSAL